MLCYDAMSHDAWSSCIDVCSDIVWNAFHMDACPGGLVKDSCAASTHLRLQGWTSGFWTFLISCFIQKDKDTHINKNMKNVQLIFLLRLR